MWHQELDIYIIYIYVYITNLSTLDNHMDFFLSIGNIKNHVATLTCREWLLSNEICYYLHYSCSKLTSHTCALLIYNVGNYLYLNNGSFKSEVGPHQFNLRKKRDFQKLAGLWLAGEMVNRIGIYGSKVAEGLSAFQRRSCFIWNTFLNNA